MSTEININNDQVLESLAATIRILSKSYELVLTYEYGALATTPGQPIKDFELTSYIRSAEMFSNGSLIVTIRDADKTLFDANRANNVLNIDQYITLQLGKNPAGKYTEFIGKIKSVSQFNKKDDKSIHLRIYAEGISEILQNRHLQYSKIQQSLIDGTTYDLTDSSTKVKALFRDFITKSEYLISKEFGPISKLPIPNLLHWFFIDATQPKRNFGSTAKNLDELTATALEIGTIGDKFHITDPAVTQGDLRFNHNDSFTVYFEFEELQGFSTIFTLADQSNNYILVTYSFGSLFFICNIEGTTRYLVSPLISSTDFPRLKLFLEYDTSVTPARISLIPGMQDIPFTEDPDLAAIPNPPNPPTTNNFYYLGFGLRTFPDHTSNYNLHDFRIYKGILTQDQKDLIRNNPHNTDQLEDPNIRIQTKYINNTSIAQALAELSKSSGLWLSYSNKGIKINTRYKQTIPKFLFSSKLQTDEWNDWNPEEKAIIHRDDTEITIDTFENNFNILAAPNVVHENIDINKIASHNASYDLSLGDIAIPFIPTSDILYKIGFLMRKITETVAFGIPITIIGSTDEGLPDPTNIIARVVIPREHLNNTLNQTNVIKFIEAVFPVITITPNILHFIFIPQWQDPANTVSIPYQTGTGDFYRNNASTPPPIWQQTTGQINFNIKSARLTNFRLYNSTETARQEPREKMITLNDITDTITAANLLKSILAIKYKPNTEISDMTISAPASPLILGEPVAIRDELLGDFTADLVSYRIESNAFDDSARGTYKIIIKLDAVGILNNG